MMTLLSRLHAIAAQRGDGLRPELLEMITPSAARSGIEQMGSTTTLEHPDATASNDPAKHVPSAEVVTLPPQKRR